jgi:hypothetical protein
MRKDNYSKKFFKKWIEIYARIKNKTKLRTLLTEEEVIILLLFFLLFISEFVKEYPINPG